jgi:hypothetical protein
MSEDRPCWGYKRKTVVMSCIALCCLSLVVWTIVITAQYPDDMLAKNGTNATNVTQLDVCTYNASEPIEQVKLYLVNDGGSNLTRRNLLQKSQEKLTPLCKCYCKLNITEEELMAAVKLLKLNALPDKLRNRKTGFTTDKEAALTTVHSPRKAATAGFTAIRSSASYSAQSQRYNAANSAYSAVEKRHSAVVSSADDLAPSASMSKMAPDKEIMEVAGAGHS